MPARVTLTVKEGSLDRAEYVFEERTTCVLGRAPECNPRIPEGPEYRSVSRHHCLLDINPPGIRIRDFGSLGGTYVNRRKIGQRERGQTPEEGQKVDFAEHDLKHGDEIRIGKVTFGVGVYVPAVCNACSREIPGARREEALVVRGVYVCATCKEEQAAAARKTAPKGTRCTRCGKDVGAEVGSRHGEYVCAACQADPRKILMGLLELARSGSKDLVAIKGYEIERELGRGGMGAVYLARRDGSAERVALKVMLPDVAVDARARKRFLDEAALARNLKHRNVVGLREVGCSDGVFFLTQEFCDGGSVHDLMKNRAHAFPVDEAASIILGTLDGLGYAHGAAVAMKLECGQMRDARGVVHRDLKPANIFLSGDGASRVAKVGDFGLAKAFDLAGMTNRTRSGMLAGTPAFMPRQQLINFKYAKPDVDVWAAAASLYFMLTAALTRDYPKGRDPFGVILSTDPVPIRQRDPRIPAKLAEVIDLALKDREGLHFQNAAEFKRTLLGAL